MRKIVLLVLLITSQQVFAKEINLFCKGGEKDSITGQNYTQKSYEITFDDVKKKVPVMTVGLMQGCFDSEYYKSTKCVCTVSERDVSCDGAFRGNSGNLIGEQSFTLNRYTGRLIAHRTLRGKESDTGKDFYLGTSGEFSCEILSKRKF